MAQELKIAISELKSKDPVKWVGKSEQFPQDHFPAIFVGCFPFLPVHARVLADWFADITANSKARHWGQQELQIKGLFILFLKRLEKKVRHSDLRKQKQFWSWVKTQSSKLIRKKWKQESRKKGDDRRRSQSDFELWNSLGKLDPHGSGKASSTLARCCYIYQLGNSASKHRLLEGSSCM